MLFAVDAHAVGSRLTGNEVYIRSLLAAMAELPGSWELLAYISRPEAEAWLPTRVRRARVSANPFVRLGADLPRLLRRHRPSLIHVQYTAPLHCPTPVVVTVHDVSFLEHPEFFSSWRAKQLRWTVRRTVARAAHVLTGSEFSARAIARHYRGSAPEITVIPHAAASMFRPVARETAAAKVRWRFGIEPPFLLAVGDLQPRKNQAGLVEAFAGLLRVLPGSKLRLVLAGKPTAYAARVRAAAVRLGVAERTHFLGYVSDEDLLYLYNACELFVFPSWYEGFGIPLLEAMACGAPVVCSNRSALPEVADAAALFFDPASTEQMVRAMRDALLADELRLRLKRLGLQRAAQFTWQRTAEQTLRIYRRVAAADARPSAASLPTAHVSRG
ncbi:MAG: glycosyltransferase family 1 protein [Bryobacterales bacterium]|nr:glycosyltransferase family 4 protein [Bryobacteraceae bacterium]MDW8130150.1 glycosyltransferase family 1 protein [Bryobacterales bacterium]